MLACCGVPARSSHHGPPRKKAVIKWVVSKVLSPAGLPNWEDGALTTLGLREAVVQPEDDLLHEVLDFTLLGAADEHHPIMREPLRGGLLAQLGPVSQL